MLAFEPNDPEYRYPGFHLLVIMLILSLLHVAIFGRYWFNVLLLLVAKCSEKSPTAGTLPQENINSAHDAARTTWHRAWESILKKRTDRLRRMIVPSAHCIFFVLLGFMGLSLIDYYWPYDTSPELMLCFAHVLFLTIFCFPWLLTEKTMNYVYSFGMLLVICAAVLGFDAQRLAVWGEVLISIRIFCSIIYLNVPLAIFWNCAYCVAVSVMFVAKYGYCATCPRDYARTFVFREVATLVIHLLILCEWRRINVDEECSFVEAAGAKNQSSALKSLLGTVCDVVVPLDVAMRIVEESPKLSCMLMHGVGRSLKGKEFQRYMPGDEERQRFTSWMSAASARSAGIPGIHHTHLRDSLGNLLCVELFHAPVLDMGEHIGYLIGIRDSVDEASIAQHILPTLGDREIDPAVAQPFGKGMSVNVSFNGLTLNMLGELPSLIAHVCGPGSGPWSFADLLVERKPFLKWIAHRVNAFAYSNDSSWPAESYGEISLRPLLHSRSSGSSVANSFKAMCSISFEAYADFEEGQNIVAHAMLSGIVESPARLSFGERGRHHRRNQFEPQRRQRGITDNGAANLSCSSSSGSSGSGGGSNDVRPLPLEMAVEFTITSI